MKRTASKSEAKKTVMSKAGATRDRCVKTCMKHPKRTDHRDRRDKEAWMEAESCCGGECQATLKAKPSCDG